MNDKETKETKKRTVHIVRTIPYLIFQDGVMIKLINAMINVMIVMAKKRKKQSNVRYVSYVRYRILF